MWRTKFLKSIICIFAFTFVATSLTSCTKKAILSQIQADVILLDVSSGLDAMGTFNEEDHSVTSLSSRARQLREKLTFALEERHAVYFGFVRKTYGQQQIETLLSPKLIQMIDETLNSDVKDANLREQSGRGIVTAWGKVISEGPDFANREDCSKLLEGIINFESNGSIEDIHSRRISSSLCESARFVNEQIEGLKNAPDDIGSEIQAAIDRSLEKLSSDQRRLFNQDGTPISLVPNVILVSDLIQRTDGKYITDILKNIADTDAACKYAQSLSENYEPQFGRMILISDGFASTKGNIDQSNRDKLKKYWECWLEGRGFTDVDLGTRGINLGEV